MVADMLQPVGDHSAVVFKQSAMIAHPIAGNRGQSWAIVDNLALSTNGWQSIVRLVATIRNDFR